MNDRLTPKPIGRVNRDENKSRNKLFHFRDKSKQEEISKLCQDYRIDIHSIVDHKIVH